MPPGILSSALLGGSVKEALSAVYRHTPQAVSHLSDIVAKSGSGSTVISAEGRSYLDFTSGIGVTSTGHCHPRVVEAIKAQSSKLVHAQQNIFGAHEAEIHCIDRLLQIMPPASQQRHMLDTFFFANSGSEAVDNAIKVARANTGKPNIIAFEGGFHGRTYGAMACTSSKSMYRQGFAPVMPQVFIAPYPACLHCKASNGREYPLPPDLQHPAGAPGRTCCNGPLEAVEWMLKMQTPPSETAAMIVEPILGEGGILTPPPGFLPGLRRLCDTHGILLILDEVQAGAGRTGMWWSHTFEQAKLEPDIMIFAKGIASGFPFAGLAAKSDVLRGLVSGSLGGTYGGNAVAMAAATATIDTIIDEGLMDNARERGQQLMQGLVDIASRQSCIIDVRGRGLMVGVELGAVPGQNEPPAGIASAVAKAAVQRGVLLMTAGPRETVRFLPPLIVSDKEVDAALTVFDAALSDIVAGRIGKCTHKVTGKS